MEKTRMVDGSKKYYRGKNYRNKDITMWVYFTYERDTDLRATSEQVILKSKYNFKAIKETIKKYFEDWSGAGIIIVEQVDITTFNWEMTKKQNEYFDNREYRFSN